jgi:hypothetical protein
VGATGYRRGSSNRVALSLCPSTQSGSKRRRSPSHGIGELGLAVDCRNQERPTIVAWQARTGSWCAVVSTCLARLIQRLRKKMFIWFLPETQGKRGSSLRGATVWSGFSRMARFCCLRRKWTGARRRRLVSFRRPGSGHRYRHSAACVVVKSL